MPSLYVMTQNRWTAVTNVDPATRRIEFSPGGAGLPGQFTGTVTYPDAALEATINATFDGDRVAVEALTVMGIQGHTVTPRDLTLLQLGEVVQHAVTDLVHPDTGAHVGRRPDRRPTPEELELVAEVYWFHHVSWGNPRRAVMELWDLPRSTASGWIRRARELYPMPEVA